MSETQHHADGEQPVHKARRVHMNSGPQITNRLESFWQILGQQGILSIDQAQRWLALLSPEPNKMKDSSILSAERTRKILRPWIDQGLLLYKIYSYRQKGVLWLTLKGIKYAQLNLRYYEPSPSSLPHMYAVNEVRLLLRSLKAIRKDEEVSPTQMMNEIIEGLDEHVRRIHLVEHESPEVADFVSSALIALLEHGTIHCGQEHLNAAREAILPLLDLSRFEERYVLRPPWE